MGQIEFIKDLLEKNTIQKYFNKGWKLEALYLLSRLNDIPLCSNYDYLRKFKFENPIFPTGILLMCEVTKNESYKKEALENAVPEFLHFNIVENVA